MKRISLWILSALISSQCLAASPKPAPKKPTGPVVQTPTIDPKKTPWDFWYTVTVGDTFPSSYYHEQVELKDGRFHYQIQIWKKEEGFINEEILGEFAKNDDALTPLFYNYKRIYNMSTLKIDGTFDDKHLLSVKANEKDHDLPFVKKQVPPGAILSYMFPVWLGKKVSKLKVNQPVSFQALLEDKREEGFPTSSGRVTLEPADDIAKQTGTKRIKVFFDNRDAIWWVKDNGIPMAIHIPLPNVLVQLTTREKAENFLK